MTERLILTLAEIAGAVVILVVILKEFFRPRYSITVNKTTNSASQPETISLSANLPWWARADKIWLEAEKLASVAVSRMQSVNEMILDVTRELHEKIAKERPAMKSKFLRRLERRKRMHVSRVLGIPIDQVTDEQIQQVVAEANGTEVGDVKRD